MDAPKRIWAVHHETLGAIMIGEWADSIRHLGGVEYILAIEHNRIVAEKDAEIARLKSECIRVDRRIRRQREQLAWWGRLFAEHVASACRRRIYHPRWTPVLYRRVKARAALKGDDNG